jgi:hypothetical protein
MEGLLFREYIKRGPVAAAWGDGSVTLSLGSASWRTSPRSLRLCYEQCGDKISDR